MGADLGAPGGIGADFGAPGGMGADSEPPSCKSLTRSGPFKSTEEDNNCKKYQNPRLFFEASTCLHFDRQS